MFQIIAYDIELNRIRTKVADILIDAGLFRVQKSVFEGSLSKRELETVISQLKPLIQSTDSIRMYEICDSCIEKTRIIGKKAISD